MWELVSFGPGAFTFDVPCTHPPNGAMADFTLGIGTNTLDADAAVDLIRNDVVVASITIPAGSTASIQILGDVATAAPCDRFRCSLRDLDQSTVGSIGGLFVGLRYHAVTV